LYKLEYGTIIDNSLIMMGRYQPIFTMCVFIGLLSFNGINSVSAQDIPLKASATAVFDNSSGELVVTNLVESEYLIQVFDLTGQEVARREVASGNTKVRISSSQFRRGVYLVRVTPASNAPSVTVKIMMR
jgi:hypothetical protein